MAQALADKQASGASAAEVAAFRAEMEAFAEMYRNPLLRVLITLSEIAPVALLAVLISAGLISRRGFMPARI